MNDLNSIFDPRTSEEIFSKRRMALNDRLMVGGKAYTTKEIIARLKPILTSERIKKLDSVVIMRSFQMVSVLENIYDRGNVSAVMRSADAFGFMRMHLVDQPNAKFKAANRVSKGAEKWLDVRLNSTATEAVSELRNDGYQIFATQLDTNVSIGSIDFSKPTAIVLGNEKDGVSPEMMAAVDGAVKIPMFGFSQSFNISVAAALLFYLARLKIDKGLTENQKEQVLANYYLRCFDSPEIYFRD
jgi:tRNA (guanosine-2'-O-)-methyltransferase